MMSSGWTATSPTGPRAGSAVHSIGTAPPRYPAPRATSREPDHVRAAWLGRHLDAQCAAAFVARREDHGSGAVAEQDAGAAIRVVEEAGEQLRPDDEDVLREPARDVRLSGGERV